MGVWSVISFIATAVGLIVWRAKRTVDEKMPQKKNPRPVPRFDHTLEESADMIRLFRKETPR